MAATLASATRHVKTWKPTAIFSKCITRTCKCLHHDLLKQALVVWGEVGGWERAEWFAPAGVSETLSYRKTEAFEHVATEVLSVREKVGLIDLSSFSKFDIIGPDAERFLDGLLANRLPKVGRIALAHVLTHSGKVQSEFTVVRLAEDHFYLVGPALCERQDEHSLRHALTKEMQVTITNITMARGCFVVAGPKSRDLMQLLTDADLSNAGLPWFGYKTCELGWATDVRLLRVNYLGELGYELHHPIAFQNHLLDQLEQAVAEMELQHVGFRALNALRLEKSYRAIKAELTTEDSLDMAGLGRLCNLKRVTSSVVRQC